MHSNYICTHIPSSILHQEDTNCGLMLFFPLQMQKLYSIHNTTVPINREGLWSSTGPVLALCASETDLVGSHLLFWMTLITGALLQRSEGACHFVSQFFLFFLFLFLFFCHQCFRETYHIRSPKDTMAFSSFWLHPKKMHMNGGLWQTEVVCGKH